MNLKPFVWGGWVFGAPGDPIVLFDVEPPGAGCDFCGCPYDRYDHIEDGDGLWGHAWSLFGFREDHISSEFLMCLQCGHEHGLNDLPVVA